MDNWDKGVIIALVATILLWLVWIGVIIWAIINIVPAIVHFLTT